MCVSMYSAVWSREETTERNYYTRYHNMSEVRDTHTHTHKE